MIKKLFKFSFLFAFIVAIAAFGATVTPRKVAAETETPSAVAVISAPEGESQMCESLEDAVSMAACVPNATVKLLSDITLSDYIAIYGGTFTFDLNGFTVDGVEDVVQQLLYISGAGTHVTFIDSAGGGRMIGGTEASGNSRYAFIVVADAAATVKSGYYSSITEEGSALVIEGGTLGQVLGKNVTITGGSILYDKAWGALFVLLDGVVTINDQAAPVIITAPEGIPHAVIYGTLDLTAYSAVEGLVVSFYSADATLLLPEGYGLFYNNTLVETWEITIPYTIKEIASMLPDPEEAAVSVTSAEGATSYYLSLSEAMAKAKLVENPTVTLLQDVTVEESFTISYPITFDFNGHVIYTIGEYQEVFYVTGEADFYDSVGGGGIEQGGVCFAFVFLQNAVATINGGRYGSLIVSANADVTINDILVNSVQVESESTLTVNGGVFLGEDAASISVFQSATLILNDQNAPIFLAEGTVGAQLIVEGTVDLSNYSNLLDFSAVFFSGASLPVLPEGYVWTDGFIPVEEVESNIFLLITKIVTVSFGANGGSGTMDAQERIAGLSFSEIECTFSPPEGLIFVGWTLEEGSGEVANEVILQDVTLYPVWQKDYDVYIGGTGLENGTYLGTDGTVSTQKPEGGYARYSEGTLTLHNFTYNGEYCKVLQAISQIYATKDITLLLEGENVLVDLDGTGSAIRADNATITVCGEGTLKVIAEQGFTVENGTLTVESGSITVYGAEYGAQVDNFTLKGGSITFISSMVGILSNGGTITISGGTFTSIGANVAIQAWNGAAVIISGGTVQAYGGGTGVVVASGSFELSGGLLTVGNVENGICADRSTVTITGGVVIVSDTTSGMVLTESDASFGGNAAVYLKGNRAFYGSSSTLSVSESLTAFPQAGGWEIGEETFYAVNGEVAPVLVLAVSVPTFGEGYAYDDANHWHVCVDETCPLPADSFIHTAFAESGYQSHSEEEICVCGYAASGTVFVGGVWMQEGTYLLEGGTVSNAAPSNASYAHYSAGVLTLSNFVYEGASYAYRTEKGWAWAAIFATDPLTVRYRGENRICVLSDKGDGIYGISDLNLVGEEGASLTVIAPSDGVQVECGSLQIEGGTLIVTTTVDGDTIDVTDGSVTIRGATVVLDSADHGIEIDVEMEEDEDLGHLFIANATVTVAAQDEGFDAEGIVVMEDCFVTMNVRDYGIDSPRVMIMGGRYDIHSFGDEGLCVGTLIFHGGEMIIAAPDCALCVDEVVVLGGKITMTAGVLIRGDGIEWGCSSGFLTETEAIADVENYPVYIVPKDGTALPAVIGNGKGKSHVAGEDERYCDVCGANIPEEVEISGVTAEDAEYTGSPVVGFTGNPTASGYDGEYEVLYVGRNGTDYPESTAAPVEVGSYTVMIRVPAWLMTVCGETRVDFVITEAVLVEPSVTPSGDPGVTPSVDPGVTPSETPSVTPSVNPGVTPSETPSVTPSETPSTAPSVEQGGSAGKGGLKGGAIAGIVIGCVSALGAIGAAVYLLIIRKKRP